MDNDKSFDIEEISKILFLNVPKEPNSIKLISIENYDDIFYPFEMMLNLYMEGVFLLGFIDLNPWFHSIGMHIKIKEHPINFLQEIDDYFCKIILKNDPVYSLWFEIKNITKEFHFINNSEITFGNIKIDKFEDLYAINIKDNILYTISFSIHF